MNQLTRNRHWPSLTLSRWQLVQLSILSVLIAGMVIWKVRYEQVLPKINPVQMVFEKAGPFNDQTFAKTTVPVSRVATSHAY